VKDHLTPATSIATRTPFRDDGEASLMVARAGRSNATDLPDGASENFSFHEFVKTEFVTRMLPGGGLRSQAGRKSRQLSALQVGYWWRAAAAEAAQEEGGEDT
jgi:hypothetical protein